MIRAIPTAGYEDARVDTYWIWVIAGIALVVAADTASVVASAMTVIERTRAGIEKSA